MVSGLIQLEAMITEYDYERLNIQQGFQFKIDSWECKGQSLRSQIRVISSDSEDVEI